MGWHQQIGFPILSIIAYLPIVGVVVALADKLETLVGMFGIGNLPTGDKDPFGLRRHALGVLRILAELSLPLDLLQLRYLLFENNLRIRKEYRALLFPSP